MPKPGVDSDLEPRRGLLDRLRNPLTRPSRHILEFCIQADDPHRQYGPGQNVTGELWLRLAKAMDITHIVMTLHGFCQAYKSPNTPGDGYRNFNANMVRNKENRNAGGYYGNGFISLFEDEQVIMGSGRLEKMQNYRMGFELKFPQENLPSSIDVYHTLKDTMPFRPSYRMQHS